jgi:hypothetical protein
MRGFALYLLGLTIGCSASLQHPDAGTGAGGAGASGGTIGTAGATGTGGTRAPCVVNGVTHPDGVEYPCSPGDCARCGCMNGTPIVFVTECRGDGGPLCVIDATYRYGDTGGFSLYEDTTTLAPARAWTRTRVSHVPDVPNGSCAVPLPCDITGESVAVEIERIKADFTDVDVQSALVMATPPTYGHDSRPVDGSVFQFLRDDGRGFVVGDTCGGFTGCVEAPAGVTKLIADLRALDARQLMDASCAALR